MPKRYKKANKNETKCSDLWKSMNAEAGPTRLESLKNIPCFVIPNFDPMQKQLNKLENRMKHEEKQKRRRLWKRK